MSRKENLGIHYTRFQRGEGAWYHGGKVYFATTATDEVWEGAAEHGLEWTIPSPAPYHTFSTPPEIKQSRLV